MKKLILASILALGFAYANKADVELEHALKTAPSAESQAGDMSKMKAAGKCNADQSAKVKPKVKVKEHTPTKAEVELEHALKTPPSPESPPPDMSKMKAAGKCNAGQ